MYKYGKLKLIEVILGSRVEKRENNGTDEPTCGTKYVCMEKPQ
jgi:hypothetical protein